MRKIIFLCVQFIVINNIYAGDNICDMIKSENIALIVNKDHVGERLHEEYVVELMRQQNHGIEEWVASAKRNILETVSFYTQFGDGVRGYGGMFLIPSVHWSPIPFLNIGLETRCALIITRRQYTEFQRASFYISISPVAGLIVPFNTNVRIFSNSLFEFGHFGSMRGKINFLGLRNVVAPAFDIGVSLDDKEGRKWEIKYRGTWYGGIYRYNDIDTGDGSGNNIWNPGTIYTHSISIGAGFRLGR